MAPDNRNTESETANKKRKRAGSVLMAGCVVALSLPLGAATPLNQSLTRFTYTEYHMGVDSRLVVYAPSQAAAEKACADAFERIAALDAMMSDYRADSELMRLCDHAGGPSVPVSPELFKVIKLSLEISRQSGGLFDITCGPIVKLWRKARKTGAMPDPKAMKLARPLVGWRMVKLDEKIHGVQLLKRGMRLDLGAIGKGYAADEAQKVLLKHGITRAMVDMGDIVVSDAPPGSDGWVVRVPDAGENFKPVDMKFVHRAISTSGDAEQFVVIGGIRFSHVVNPLTGWALTNRVEATVVAPDGLTSDPLSTCMTLLRPADRAKLLKLYPGTQAYVKVQ